MAKQSIHEKVMIAFDLKVIDFSAIGLITAAIPNRASVPAVQANKLVAGFKRTSRSISLALNKEAMVWSAVNLLIVGSKNPLNRFGLYYPLGYDSLEFSLAGFVVPGDDLGP